MGLRADEGDGVAQPETGQAFAQRRLVTVQRLVGITGSLGKTSTKEQVAEVLSERWNVLRNNANENNEVGLPLTLLRLEPAHAVAVLEMGMYVPGDIGALAALARPKMGVVTAVRGTPPTTAEACLLQEAVDDMRVRAQEKETV